MQNLLLVIIKFFQAMHMWNVYNTFLYEIPTSFDLFVAFFQIQIKDN